jgi:hypothetical protein
MKTHHVTVKKKKKKHKKIGLKTPDIRVYGAYHVDMGRCVSDTQEFRNQIKGAHEAPFPGPARELECIMGTGQHEIQHLQNGYGRKLCGLLG